MPGFDTAATIISDVARELGLVSADIANPWSSPDPNVLQLVALLKPTGRELLKAHQWSHLSRTGVLDLDGSEPYPYPLVDWVTDFGRLVDDTFWEVNTDIRYRAVSAQQWQQISATGTVGAYVVRVWGDSISIDPQPVGGERFEFEYISRYWGAAAFAKEAPTAAADVIQFDAHLFGRLLKVRFQAAKGIDTTAAVSDYREALAAAIGQDGASPTLSLNGPRALPYPNVPETGFGG